MNAPPSSTSRERGFVLVGVVMFVLALTILGLSLFALSSYEGQFVSRSSTSSDALDVAMSGLEHAKFVLASRGRLEDVGTSLYPAGVVYASARRADDPAPADTTGALFSPTDSSNITIRVLANVDGERRMVEAQYKPDQTPQLYKRLMTIQDSLIVRHDASTDPPDTNSWSACDNYYFQGEIYEGGHAGTSWRSCVRGLSASSRSNVTLPLPDVQAFFGEHLYAAGTRDAGIPVDRTGHNDLSYYLDTGNAPAGQVNYFRTENADTRGLCSLYIPSDGRQFFRVKGWVVWMLPQGLNSYGRVRVVGTTGNDCLVIVAGASQDPDCPYPYDYGRYLGIEFSQSFNANSNFSAPVPVILVTDGWFLNEHWHRTFRDSDADYLSVFAKSAGFWGPEDPNTMTLRHNSWDSNDDPGGLIDKLCDLGALPNAQSGSLAFRSVPGTWRELNPDNPPPY
jgi:hypothetical protein